MSLLAPERPVTEPPQADLLIRKPAGASAAAGSP